MGGRFYIQVLFTRLKTIIATAPLTSPRLSAPGFTPSRGGGTELGAYGPSRRATTAGGGVGTGVPRFDMAPGRLCQRPVARKRGVARQSGEAEAA